MLSRQPAKSHSARKWQAGLKANTDMFQRNNVAASVKSGNGLAPQMNDLAIFRGDQADGIAAKGVHVNAEEGWFGDRTEVGVLLIEIPGCLLRPGHPSALKVLVLARCHKAVKSRHRFA